MPFFQLLPKNPHQKSTSILFSDVPFLTEYLSFAIISIREGLPPFAGRLVQVVGFSRLTSQVRRLFHYFLL
nr:MAG TPA: hypothetical protein [Caudoviricetes sp.]